MHRHQKRQRGTPFGGGMAGTAFTVLLLGYVDLTTNTQMLGLAAAAISTPFVNPPPKDRGEKRLKLTPVALFERLRWGSKLPHDLDVWTQCYNLANGGKDNVTTVGYLRKSEAWLDLLRDDQGGNAINEEQLQSNSEVSKIPPSTFCRFNVHLYHSHGGVLPVDGELIVIQNKDGDDELLIGDIKFQLQLPGQEFTILTAAWDEHGNLIPEAVEKYPDVKTLPIATNIQW